MTIPFSTFPKLFSGGSQIRLIFLLLSLAFLYACGSSSSTSSSGVTTIVVNPPSANVAVLGQQLFSASAFDATGNQVKGITFTWSSDNSNVAAVNADGLATGSSPGTTNIVARIGLTSGNATLTVTNGSLEISSPSTNIPICNSTQPIRLVAIAKDGDGNQVSLDGKTITWDSSNDSIATVDANGDVAGVNVGSVTITASVDGMTGSISLQVVSNVGSVPSAVSVSPAAATIPVGDTQVFSAAAIDNSGNVVCGVAFTWSVDKPLLASFSSISSSTGAAIVAGDNGGQVTVKAADSLSPTTIFGTATLTIRQFKDRVQHVAGAKPNDVVTGDIDGDGQPDAAAVNFDSSSLMIFYGDGTGALPTRSILSTGLQPIAAIAIDLDGNGKKDLVTANWGDPTLSQSPSLTVFMQTSSRNFSSSTVSLARGGGLIEPIPFGIAAGHFDGDANVDLAITDIATGVVMVLRGNGDGTFLPAVETSTGGSPFKLVAANLDGVGTADDLALVIPGNNQVIILTNKDDGSGTFDIGATYTGSGTRPSALILADADNDIKDDLIVVNQGVTAGSESLSIFLSGSGGLLSALNGTPMTVSLNSGTEPVAITAADFNNDGNVDLAVANAKTSNVTVLFGDGNGNFSNGINEPAGLSPSAIGSANLDGSISPDLLVANGGDNSLSVLLNTN